jgi:hypothetical protein
MHSYTQSVLVAVTMLPLGWKVAWCAGVLIFITAGLTVLVAIPGSFFIPIILWCDKEPGIATAWYI